MSTVRSMTGFARVRRGGDAGEVTLGIKSLNHRALDLHFHLPAELDAFEPALRGILKRRVARGHFDIRASYQAAAAPATLSLNRSLLDAYLEAFKQAARDHRLMSEPDLNAALRLPGMFVDAAADSESGAGELITAAMEEAIDLLNAFREREGAETVEVLKGHSRAVASAVERIGEIRRQILPQFEARLTERLSDLLNGAGIEPHRIVQEAAILADRSDIGEEVARLRIHTRQLDELLGTGGEVGKKLDFLLQEMNREATTILSKTAAAGEGGLRITDQALAMKADIEKIREQALNLE